MGGWGGSQENPLPLPDSIFMAHFTRTPASILYMAVSPFDCGFAAAHFLGLPPPPLWMDTSVFQAASGALPLCLLPAQTLCLEPSGSETLEAESFREISFHSP